MPSKREHQELLGPAGTVVRAILRRKSGMSLRDDDTRHDNVEVLELCQEVMARLWEQHRTGPPDDLPAYAASVTHNAWSDHLRRKYPKRASLKNRVRYFLAHQGAFASWNGADGELLTGLHGWQLESRTPVDATRLGALRDGRTRLPAGSVPRKDMERFLAADWHRLLNALFVQFDAPLALDELVGLLAALLDLREDRVDSLDALAESEGGFGVADSMSRSPERIAELRSMMQQLWGAVLALKPDHRRAYLLNLPGAGKTRGDLEVFLLHGIASVADIEAALGLDDAHYRLALAMLPATDEERSESERCASSLERFCLLWRHLPLADTVIASLLRMEQQQVINRRMLAVRELARLLSHPAGAGTGSGPNR